MRTNIMVQIPSKAVVSQLHSIMDRRAICRIDIGSYVFGVELNKCNSQMVRLHNCAQAILTPYTTPHRHHSLV